MELFPVLKAPRPALLALAAALFVLPVAAQAAPKATVEPMTLDLGEIEEGGQYERYIELTNTGDGVLTLEDVKTSCGCTAAAVDSDVELKAGETQKIRITFNSRNQEGGVTKKITVRTNDPVSPALEVVLRANVHRSLRWDPRYLSFNNIGLSDKAEQVVKVEGDKNLHLKILNAFVQGGLRGDKDSHLFSVAVSDMKEGDERDGYDLTVKMNDRRRPQRISETLVVVTNVADKDTLKIPIRGEVQGRISFTPSYAVLALVDPGQETTRDVVLSASDGTFKVKKAEVVDSPVKAEVIPDPKTGHVTIHLTYVGEAAGANGVRQLKIETDDPDQPLIEVPVRYQTRTPAPDSGVAAKGPGS